MNALLARLFDRFKRQRRRAFGNGRRDAGHMEPRRIFQRLIPVDVAGLCAGDRAVGAVVDHFAGALNRAGFQIIDPQPFSAAHDAVHVYAKAAQFTNAGLRDVIFGQHAHESGVHSKICQRDGNVCFAATKGRLQCRGLEKALKPGTFEAQHDFAKGHNSRTHFLFLLAVWLLSIHFLSNSVVQTQQILTAQRAVVQSVSGHADLSPDVPSVVRADGAVKADVDQCAHDLCHIK